MRREKGHDASLGVEISRNRGGLSIAHLTYLEISRIFVYLDADTLIKIHVTCQDVVFFHKVQQANEFGKQPLAITALKS